MRREDKGAAHWRMIWEGENGSEEEEGLHSVLEKMSEIIEKLGEGVTVGDLFGRGSICELSEWWGKGPRFWMRRREW